ncbi:MAG: class I SAM-dependent methyltransferase [Tenericutes bacterium]|nr:class I SAM-dependent methyltransferase [Mycoplasmatota bacterium]
MSHYYTNDSTLDHKVKSYDVQIKSTSFRFYTDLGVFSKDNLDYGTKFLLETIELESNIKKVIDMGCGYGPIGLYVAKTYPDKKVFLYDVNQRALDLAQKNKIENNITNAEIAQSFLFENVKINVDAIITNPPIRAGKQIVFRLYEEAYGVLNQGGILYVVIQKKQGAPSSVKKLEEIFGQCSIIEKNKGYWILSAKK